MLFKDSNAAGGWVLADLVLVDHHVDARDTRGVHLVLGLLAGELREELKQLRFAGFHLKAVVVVELNKVLLVILGRVLMFVSGVDRAIHHSRGRWCLIDLLDMQLPLLLLIIFTTR